MRPFTILKLTSLLLAIVYCTNSCTVVGTFYPVYDNEKNFLFKKELMGKWSDREDKRTIIIVDTTSKLKYDISVINKDDDGADTTHFTGRLVNNGNFYFLEFWYRVNEELDDLVIARHFIAKLTFAGKDKLEVNFIDAEKLIKLIDQRKLQLTYAKQKTGAESYSYLILDKSTGLQKAVAELKKYPDVFNSKLILTKSE